MASQYFDLGWRQFGYTGTSNLPLTGTLNAEATALIANISHIWQPRSGTQYTHKQFVKGAPAFSQTLTQLEPGNMYLMNVTAAFTMDNATIGVFQGDGGGMTPRVTPTNLSAVANGPDVTLVWTGGSGDATIHRSVNGSAFLPYASGYGNQFEDYDLADGNYAYKVALLGDGVNFADSALSAPSNTVIIAAPAGPVDVIWTSGTGVAITDGGTTVTKTAATGWGNAGAIATQQIETTGSFFFNRTQAGDAVAIGLSDVFDGVNHEQIKFGVYFDGAISAVYENGSYIGTAIFNDGGISKWEWRVTESAVEYYRNEVLVHTSAKPIVLPLLICAAYYATTDSYVTGAKFLAGDSNAVTGFGDSIMAGYWAVQPVGENGFFGQFAAHLGGVAYNHAIPSARVGINTGENGGINFVDKYNTMPIAPNGYLLTNYGANDDVANEGKEDWKTRYKDKVNYLIAQGFNPNKICLITVPYHPSTVSSYEFNSGAIVEIATELGVKCADIWTLMQPNYADYFSGDDFVHPNQAGHDFIFQKILETFGLTTEVPTEPVWTEPTKYASFDKVDDGISVSVPLTVPCTIEAKVRFNSNDTIHGVMGSSSAGADFDFITNPGNNAPLVYTNNTDTTRTTSAGAEIPPNEWHHVAFVFLTGFRIQYLDGVQVGMDDKTSQGFTLETLGYCVTQNFGTPRIGGDMAEVRVWSKALAEEEVQTARVTRYTAPQANILANWLMDGNANDVSGNNYHGTPAGGVTFV